MFLNNTIKRIIKEETEEWVEVLPDEYNDLLKYVNGDGLLIKKLPGYKDKKIKIVGNLELDDFVTNIDSIDYVDGNLDLGSSKVSYFDKSKVKKNFTYYNSKMYRLEREKILKIKRDYQEELRQDDEWNVENGETISEQTEAIFDHLVNKGIVNEGEDKYNLYKEKYEHYGEGGFYSWLGDNEFESEWVVYADDDIRDAAYKKLEYDIEELGYDAFYSHIWEDHLEDDEVRRWLYSYFEDDVRYSPENFDIKKELSSQQKRYVEIYEEKIHTLIKKQNTGNLTDEEYDNIEDEIKSIEQLIEDFKENPEGDYSEDEIEDAIEGMVDNHADDFADFIKDQGFNPDFILDFVDMDSLINYVINSDGYGNILNGYDGGDDEYKIGDTWYHVMRYN